jgi:hypothetical protein
MTHAVLNSPEPFVSDPHRSGLLYSIAAFVPQRWSSLGVV